MKLTDFSYDLPTSFVAQEPLSKRDQSRLMILRSSVSSAEHRFFYDLPQFLRSGDVLVLNNTKVLPARLMAKKSTGGNIEIFLLKNVGGNDWEALVRPSNKFKEGAVASIDQNGFSAEALDEHQFESSSRVVRLRVKSGGSVEEKLEEHGHVPLPPYIKRSDTHEDRERYQTVFADSAGAVAAPTAGLHFTPELLSELRSKGIEIVFLTLHVGLGTFKPVTAERIEDHQMHFESFAISKESADRINSRKGRLIACGTTVIRALESASDANGKIRPMSGETNLFIYPAYQFKTADLLITNFHLPHSTLLMLVTAFGGYELVMSAYESAKANGYRFFSYGDAMLLERKP